MLKLQNSLIPFSKNGISEIDPPKSSNLFIPTDFQYTDKTKTYMIFKEDKKQTFNA
jgi:hypothetical protein